VTPERAPAALRAASTATLALATFLVLFAALVFVVAVVTGSREIAGAWAIAVLVLLLGGTGVLTVVVVRSLARWLRDRGTAAHVVAILLGLVLCAFFVPAPFVYTQF
jgi:hypothetical protein